MVSAQNDIMFSSSLFLLDRNLRLYKVPDANAMLMITPPIYAFFLLSCLQSSLPSAKLSSKMRRNLEYSMPCDNARPSLPYSIDFSIPEKVLVLIIFFSFFHFFSVVSRDSKVHEVAKFSLFFFS